MTPMCAGLVVLVGCARGPAETPLDKVPMLASQVAMMLGFMRAG